MIDESHWYARVLVANRILNGTTRAGERVELRSYPLAIARGTVAVLLQSNFTIKTEGKDGR